MSVFFDAWYMYIYDTMSCCNLASRSHFLVSGLSLVPTTLFYVRP